MTHLLVTNDFPPKVGGIQSYLWELWRRLPAAEFAVLTTPYAGASDFDASQPFRIERSRERVLLPHPGLVRRIDALAREIDASLVLLDPALPLGLLGPRLERPYGVVLHGAEVTVPARLPASGAILARVLRGARLVVAAGGYPAAEARRVARRDLPTVIVPPGVDTRRFHPLDDAERVAARRALGLDPHAPLVVGVSRLVPRKGFDTVLRAVALVTRTHPGVSVAIAGAGRDAHRLRVLAARFGAPARFLGRIDDEQLPLLYGCADVFAMACRNRWAGLEQEGFGIVFLEAAAAGVPQVAGRSGGAAEAVVDGDTGFVIDPADSVADVAAAIARILGDPDLRSRLAAASRARAVAEFSHDVLAGRLRAALAALA